MYYKGAWTHWDVTFLQLSRPGVQMSSIPKAETILDSAVVLACWLLTLYCRIEGNPSLVSALGAEGAEQGGGGSALTKVLMRYHLVLRSAFLFLATMLFARLSERFASTCYPLPQHPVPRHALVTANMLISSSSSQNVCRRETDLYIYIYTYTYIHIHAHTSLCIQLYRHRWCINHNSRIKSADNKGSRQSVCPISRVLEVA